ncbi:hypothetical protein VPHD51_0068 [Vibrio phage D51]
MLIILTEAANHANGGYFWTRFGETKTVDVTGQMFAAYIDADGDMVVLGDDITAAGYKGFSDDVEYKFSPREYFVREEV